MMTFAMYYRRYFEDASPNSSNSPVHSVHPPFSTCEHPMQGEAYVHFSTPLDPEDGGGVFTLSYCPRYKSAVARYKAHDTATPIQLRAWSLDDGVITLHSFVNSTFLLFLDVESESE